METTYSIVIQGRVQGVGFRPFVYREAIKHGIRGSVSNNEEGVVIRATGKNGAVEAFYHDLVAHPPAISRVLRHGYTEVPAENPADFRIIPSARDSRLNLQLTPDFAICPECAAELADPGNRRFGYPFISCVNCGPRWAITESFPFEREHTSMRHYPMCPECTKEYTDPSHRRFHSQTNSCARCGIPFWLEGPNGDTLTREPSEIFHAMARMLASGAILAVKNTTGYLLCCDARNEKAIRELRRRKKRPGKPFALLYPSLDRLRGELPVPEPAARTLCSPERPIVLLSSAAYRGPVRLEAIAPGLHQLGVMLPYSGVLDRLAAAFPHPMVATSGNLHGSPICHDAAQARSTLREVADTFFHHDLPIVHPQDDSVVRFAPETERPILLRRSRGLAPNYGKGAGKASGSRLLALGAHLKSSIGFIPNDFLYISQYLGNLDNYEVSRRFEDTVRAFTGLFDVRPSTVLTDSHPEYQSTLYGKALAQRENIPIRSVQHHRAHFAAVLGEHELFECKDPILGVVWDGTGYGEDGQVWGGEFFTCHRGSMKRSGHLAYFDWLAGDKMAREPRLSLFSLLPDAATEKFTPEELRVYTRLRESNPLKTSSVGRLLDAAASLLGLCDYNTYEGEAAMLLEARAMHWSRAAARQYGSPGAYGDPDAAALLRELALDRDAGTSVPQLAGNLLYTLVTLIFEKASREEVRKIAFSGGVFQNAFLVDALETYNPGGFDLYFHEAMSPNDENIAFGQLMYHINCGP